MRIKALGHGLLISSLAAVSFTGHSQELDLFQDDGNGRRAQFAQAGPPAAGAPTAATASTVTLKGIYRFGDTYHISLENDERATDQATWRSGQEASVPIMNGYELQAVDSRTVTLGMPQGMNCQASALSGGNCIGRTQVSLSFAETEPVDERRNFRGRGNNNDNIPTFLRNNNDGGQGGGTDIRALIEAANGGDPRAIVQVEELRQSFGGRGGRGGGRGGANNNGGNNNGGRNGGGRNGGGGPQ
jgi:hypothetical protein